MKPKEHDPTANEFFVVALPGLEDLVLQEINDWFPDLKGKQEHGGVTVFTTLEQGLALNLVLKTATRVLLRIERGRIRDFPKLYNVIAHVPWNNWIDLTCEMDVEVATRLSRLKMKNRIREACLDGWIEHVLKNEKVMERGKKATMFVRFHNDDCTISLDTSGDRLHKRGLKEEIGEAPLRETIAAALIKMVVNSDPEAKDVEVVDPMMGTATFLLESMLLNQVVDQREFPFNIFVAQPQAVEPLENAYPSVSKVYGFESDIKTFNSARNNLKGNAGHTQVELVNEDFFEAKAVASTVHRRWLFCNPPYGERLKVEGQRKDLYQKIFEKAEEVFKPDRACFLLPADGVKGKFVLPAGWKVLEKRPFVNGGIPVIAFVFGKEA